MAVMQIAGHATREHSTLVIVVRFGPAGVVACQALFAVDGWQDVRTCDKVYNTEHCSAA